MKETWKKSGSIKIKILRDEPPASSSSAAVEMISQCEILRLMVFYALLIACITTASYVSWRLYCYDATATTIYLTRDELGAAMRKIIGENDEFARLFAGKDRKDEYVGEVEILDADWNVIWKKSLNHEGLRSLKVDREEDNNDALRSFIDTLSHPRRARSVDEPPSSRPKRSYVVSHTSQYVPCDRFKPVPRGRYLVSPSLHALHHCYRHGVRRAELRRGLRRNQGDAPRYVDLGDLYVECAEVFDDRLDELTDRLRGDYERCKWSGALDLEHQEIIEERFKEKFVGAADGADAGAPSNLILRPPPTTAAAPRPASHRRLTTYDPRTFVECSSRFESELFDGYFESPSLEVLERCRDHGVTLQELQRGVAARVRGADEKDSDRLYLSCQEVFQVPLDYLTAELKRDYGRCKRLGAVRGEVQRMVEKRFHDALYGTLDDTTVASHPALSPPTTSSSSAEDTEMTTVIWYNDELDVPKATSSSENEGRKSNKRRRYAYANCRRVEREAYLICIKVLRVPRP